MLSMGNVGGSPSLYGYIVHKTQTLNPSAAGRLHMRPLLAVSLQEIHKAEESCPSSWFSLVWCLNLMTYQCGWDTHIWLLSTEELMLLNCGAREDSRVPWTTRRSNQSILKEINPESSLEGLVLKLQSFRYLMWTAWLEKTLMLAEIKGKRRGLDRGWDGRIASLTHGHESKQTSVDSEGQGSLVCCSPWGHRELDMTEWLNNNIEYTLQMFISVWIFL